MNSTYSKKRLSILRASLASLLFATVSACLGGDPAPDPALAAESDALTGSALLVVGSATLGTPDIVVKSRMEGLGLTVVVKEAAASSAADAAGSSVVVVAGSAKASDVNTKFRDVANGVVCLNDALFDDFAMTGPTSGTDFGETANQTELALRAVSSTLASGLNVTTTISAQTFGWGKPSSSAIKVAALTTNTNRLAVFAYDNGKPMVGLDAPGRRVGWFAVKTTASSLSANGWKLFDNAVKWAATGSPPPPPPPPCDPNQGQPCGNCGGTIQCDGQCSADPSGVGTACVSGGLGVCRRNGTLQCLGGSPTLACTPGAGTPDNTFESAPSTDPAVDMSTSNADYNARWDYNCDGNDETLFPLLQSSIMRSQMCQGNYEAACNQLSQSECRQIYANCDSSGGLFATNAEACGRPFRIALCLWGFNTDGLCSVAGNQINDVMPCK
jgi:hypothetical protein